VIVQRGETLDRVIARTLRDSPFRPEVLREAFMRLNRSAFPRGTPHWVTAGAVLQVPTFADVMAGIDPQLWSPGMAHAVPDPSSGPTTQRTEADRKNWIRYP
jgi:Tfp pilus assembly protein FimV